MFVNATGAQGGGGDDQSSGGRGGWVQASLSVTAGQKLYIYVGGDGSTGNSFNGGGLASNAERYGGGGASDIRTISGNLTSRLIVAGGGGGFNLYTIAGNGGTKLNLRFCFLISTIFCL